MWFSKLNFIFNWGIVVAWGSRGRTWKAEGIINLQVDSNHVPSTPVPLKMSLLNTSSISCLFRESIPWSFLGVGDRWARVSCCSICYCPGSFCSEISASSAWDGCVSWAGLSRAFSGFGLLLWLWLQSSENSQRIQFCGFWNSRGCNQNDARLSSVKPWTMWGLFRVFCFVF